MRPELLIAWEAFFRLSADRPALVEFATGPMGGAVGRTRRGAIPFAALDRYAARMGIEGEAFDDLLVLIDAMEAEHRKVIEEQEKADA